MVKTIEDEQEQVFLLSGMLVFSDKVIRSEDSKKMRNWIMMTKIGKMFEEVSDIASSLTLDELFELSEEVKKEKK